MTFETQWTPVHKANHLQEIKPLSRVFYIEIGYRLLGVLPIEIRLNAAQGFDRNRLFFV